MTTRTITEVQTELTEARAQGYNGLAAALLGELCTMRRRAEAAAKDRHPSNDQRLSPFATAEQTDEFFNQQAALAEERANSPMVGVSASPFDAETERAYRAFKNQVVSLDAWRSR